MLPDAVEQQEGMKFPLVYLTCGLGFVAIWAVDKINFGERSVDNSGLVAVAAGAKDIGASICYVSINPVTTYGTFKPAAKLKTQAGITTLLQPEQQNEEQQKLLQNDSRNSNDEPNNHETLKQTLAAVQGPLNTLAQGLAAASKLANETVGSAPKIDPNNVPSTTIEIRPPGENGVPSISIGAGSANTDSDKSTSSYRSSESNGSQPVAVLNIAPTATVDFVTADKKANKNQDNKKTDSNKANSKLNGKDKKKKASSRCHDVSTYSHSHSHGHHGHSHGSNSSSCSHGHSSKPHDKIVQEEDVDLGALEDGCHHKHSMSSKNKIHDINDLNSPTSPSTREKNEHLHDHSHESVHHHHIVIEGKCLLLTAYWLVDLMSLLSRITLLVLVFV